MKELLKSKKFILVLMIISIFVVIALLIIMTKQEAQRFGFIKVSVSKPEQQDIDNDNYDTTIEYGSIDEVFESYGCKCTEIIKNEYYLKFPKDVFDEEGKANTVYFESLIHSCGKTLQLPSFVLDDTEQCIRIKVKYNKSSDTYSYSINGISGYFSEVNSEAYKDLDDLPKLKIQQMAIKDELLSKLNSNNMKVIDELGAGNAISKEDNYSVFLNNTVKTRNFNGRTRNIIFCNGYPEEIFDGIKVGTPLNAIKQEYPDFSFQGKNYVGYKTDDFYVFFYEDEISIYPYSDRENNKLVNFIEDYYESKDIAEFEKNVRTNFMNYDNYEFNEDEKRLKIDYPANGVMINIVNDDTTGIVFYNNCYVSKRLKKLVSEGKVKVELYKNSIEEEEKARVNNK